MSKTHVLFMMCTSDYLCAVERERQDMTRYQRCIVAPTSCDPTAAIGPDCFKFEQENLSKSESPALKGISKKIEASPGAAGMNIFRGEANHNLE
jgi:hypothetical protein